MLQRLNPQYTAVLLRIPPPSTTAAHSNNNSQHESESGVKDAKMTVSAWDTKFEDPQRQQYHDKKMQSKNSRPAAQLQALSIDAGHVLHEIDL